MKKITFVLLAFLIGNLTVFSQVQVGTGNNSTQKVPYHPFYGYSYGQSIYLASEISASGTITAIKWYYNGNLGMPNSQQLVVYLGTTTKTSFSSSSDWEPASNLTEVYSGGVPATSSGWVTITLSTPFVYDGVSNLVVAADENQPGFDGLIDTFRNTFVDSTRSLCYFSDNDNPDINIPPTANYSSGYIPNIIFEGLTQSCSMPLYLAASNITTNSATLSWQNVGVSAGGTEYILSNTPFVIDGSSIPTGTIATGNSLDLTTLLPQTNYYFAVRNVCDTAEVSTWTGVEMFTTDCVAVSNFNENFDSVEIPYLPICWSKILRGATISSFAAIETQSGNNVHSNPNSVSLYNSGSDTLGSDDLILVSPNLSTLGTGTYRIKFYGKNASVLQIGTLSDNSNNAIFSLVETLYITDTATEYAVNFTNPTTDQYIGFRNASTAYSSVILDDIRWEIAPTCPDVTQITIPEISINGATVNWTSNGSETMWDVVVGNETATDPNLITPQSSSMASIALTGLIDATKYQVWVRSVCANNDLGAWIGPIAFKTDCLPVTSISENFDYVMTPELPNCWSKIMRGNTISQFANIDTNNFSSVHSAPNAVSLYNSSSNTGPMGDDIILVSPNLSTLSLGTYRLKFFAKNEGSLEIGTVDVNTNQAVFSLFETITTTINATEFAIDFTPYTGTDKYFAIRMNTPNIYTTISLDDIRWEIAPTCPDVTLINVPTIGTNTATIEWTSNGSELLWDVAFGPLANTDPNMATIQQVNSPTATISGLIDNTKYNVWVRSVCANNDNGAWIGPIMFVTACLPTVAFNENFDSVITPDLPNCWTKILRGSTISQWAGIQTTAYPLVNSLPNTLQMYNDNSNTSAGGDDIILVSPSLSTLASGTYRLKFYNKYAGAIEIGTLDSNTATAVFTPIQEIVTIDDIAQYVVDFTSYTGTDMYIGIRMSSTSQYITLQLDDIKWEIAPLCPDISQIMATNITTSAADINWTAGGSEANWQVVYGATTETNPDAIANPISTATNSTTISGLAAATSYNVWVRSVCGLNYGIWVGPIVVKTLCNPTTLPYSQNFENAIFPEIPDCTSYTNDGAGTHVWHTSDVFLYGFNSRVLQYKWDFANEANTWFFTQGINLTQGQNYTISYKYGNSSVSFYSEKFKIMYGNAPDSGSMTLLLADHPLVNGASATVETISFSPPTTATYYFGFNAYSLPNQDYLYIDDIIIDVALSNNQNSFSQLKYYPNPVKKELLISNDNKIEKVSLFNLLGQKVYEQFGFQNNIILNVANLPSGHYLATIVSENQSKTIKIVKE